MKRLLLLLGQVAWYTGSKEIGLEAIEKALSAKPGDQRLLNNLEFYRRYKKGGKET